MFLKNQTSQLLVNHKQVREVLKRFLDSKLYSKPGKTYRYEDKTQEYWQRLLHSFVKKTQKRALTTKKKMLNLGLKKHKVTWALFKQSDNISKTVQTCYGFFFLNFFHNAVNSAFRNKKITISNTYSKALDNTRKFTHPLNKIYVRLYRTLVCKEPFNTAKPVMSYLIRSSSYKSTTQADYFMQRRHLLIGLYAMLYNSPALGKNKENTKTLTHRSGYYPVTRNSKAIYSINQFLLNFFI